MHGVLKSYDTLGGPTTNGVMLMTKKFRDANPKVTAAVYAALVEAEDFINKNASDAAQIYIRPPTKSAAPRTIWPSISPIRTMLDDHAAAVDEFATFMHKVGTMKRLPASWKDMYMPELHELKGS